MALILTLVLSPSAGPSRFGFSDRVERHLFPEVTTGPAEPVWSPDGQWIAFSMHGDIWKVPAEGGEAIALTKGPWYYFEPDWSPDGRTIACTMDTGGNLDLGLVQADGSGVERLTSAPEVELEPTWSRDGRSIYFVGRGRGFDILRLSLADRSVTPVIAEGGDQLQPAISPDGRTLAFVSPVSGRLGTGGIWTRQLGDDGQPTAEAPALVLYEESEYRMRPRWMPDGQSFLFGSDALGSNDIAVVAARGGNPVVVTNDGGGEFSPAPSPDGETFAFISNRTGPMTLHVTNRGGGPAESWRTISVSSRRPAVPYGRARVRVVGADGMTTPARIQVTASDGRAYAPDAGFARVIAATETHYFHTMGEFEIDVPTGVLQVEALRGFEFAPASEALEIREGETTTSTLTLRRRVDPQSRGWFSGDTHAHDLHQGRFGLTHRTLFEQSLAEDLHVTHVLIHMDGTRLMGRWADLTGEPLPLSTATHILQFGEEFRGSLGHIGMLGVSRYILPLIGGVANTAYDQPASDLPYLDGARAQGGIAGFMHPYTSISERPEGWANSLIPVDVALGKGDFYDVVSLYSDERASAEMYYKLLNCGFKLPATGGTDNFPDVWRDPPPGTGRTYARISGRLTVQNWNDAVREGRTFATNGPLVFLTVDDREPGASITTSRGSVQVRATVQSNAPIERLDIVVNGRVAASAVADAADTTSLVFDAPVEIPAGGWVAARVSGPSSRYIADSYAFAQTTPVYVTREGRPPFVSVEDAKFLAAVVDAIWTRASRGRWRSDAERDAFKVQIDVARDVYARRAGVGRDFSPAAFESPVGRDFSPADLDSADRTPAIGTSDLEASPETVAELKFRPAGRQTREPFPWAPNRRLTWSDFLGKPAMMTDASALTAYALSVSWGCTGDVFTFRVESMFQPTKSWVKPALLMRRGGESARVLDHEQSHFDLSEVQARKLRKAFSELPEPCAVTEADMNELVTKHLRADFDIQQRYDQETVWGLDVRRQAHWVAEVGKQLSTLAKYVH